MAYATYTDVEARLGRTLSADEQTTVTTQLSDAADIIDSYNANASAEAKKIVSCRMIIRWLDTGLDIPIGATQGSQSGLGYSQSWTVGGGGSNGQLYVDKTDKKLLGVGNKIGSHSPLEDPE